MLRIIVCLAAALLVAGSIHAASAQSTTAPAATEAKPSKMKLTREKLKAMRAKWSTNKPKMRACKAEVKARGLAGDDRWLYISDCMDKS